jgi:hypothetical protein
VRNLYICIWLATGGLAGWLGAYAGLNGDPWYAVLVGGMLSGFSLGQAFRLVMGAPLLHEKPSSN